MNLNPLSGIRNPESVRNIIFDFGGVICDLDIPRTQEKFKAFGPPRNGAAVSPAEADRNFGLLVEQLESGRIEPSAFRETIRDFYLTPPTDAMIDDAWNALLQDIPDERIRLLEKLRHEYRVFLLSNSNKIHYDCYSKRFTEKFGYPDFDTLFEKAWFSFRMGMKKPDIEIFKYVISHHRLIPSETLFIDDTLEHINSAESIGIQGYHLKPGEDVTALFTS